MSSFRWERGQDCAILLEVFHQLCSNMVSTNILVQFPSVYYHMLDGGVLGTGNVAIFQPQHKLKRAEVSRKDAGSRGRSKDQLIHSARKANRRLSQQTEISRRSTQHVIQRAVWCVRAVLLPFLPNCRHTPFFVSMTSSIYQRSRCVRERRPMTSHSSTSRRLVTFSLQSSHWLLLGCYGNSCSRGA